MLTRFKELGVRLRAVKVYFVHGEETKFSVPKKALQQFKQLVDIPMEWRKATFRREQPAPLRDVSRVSS